MKITVLLFIFLVAKSVLSFVPTKTEYGTVLKWPVQNLNMKIDPLILHQNTSEINANYVKELTKKYFDNLEGVTGITTTLSVDTNVVVGSTNSIRFESNSAYFGSGILAITSLSHSASTGEIFKADILINDTILNQNKFSSTKSSTGGNKVYIGDVIAHEIGHLFGLGHTDAQGSTMMFSVFKGQNSFHTDDLVGLDYLYGQRNKFGSGVISGRVAGGNNIGVFGAQVQAISHKTGKVISSVLSEESGNFKIENLNTNDSYIVYILPPRGINHLPGYYASVQQNYCNGNSYVPSFFTKCGGREKGKPQVLNFQRNSNIDLGVISIRCDEKLATNYLFNKTKEVRDPIDLNLTDGTETVLGYFSSEEINNAALGLKDIYRLDLSRLNPENTSLKIRILSEQVGSNLSLIAKLKEVDGDIVSAKAPTYDELGKLNTDLELVVDLAENTNSNIFELEIDPIVTSSSDAKGIFGNKEVMANKNSTYLLMISLSGSNHSGTWELYKDSYPYSDNSSCLESNITVETKANTPFSASKKNGTLSEEQQPLTCGTIDIANDNGDGPGGFTSFAFGVLLSSICLLLNGLISKESSYFSL